jgi:hypothetical protein
MIINSILSAHDRGKYDTVLQEKFQRYFNMRPGGNDPLDEARKLVRDEQREVGDLSRMVITDDSMLDLLRDIVAAFPGDPSFEMKNIVINDRIVRLDGSIGSSASLDAFKQKLDEIKGFEAVSLNIRSAHKNDVRFSMTIKQKVPAPGQKGEK